MNRIKTYDATGIAPNGRLYAGDLNLLQDTVAALADFTQNLQAGSIALGDSSLSISKFGAGELQVSNMLRTLGIFRAAAGFLAGSFTTTTRNAISNPPYGLTILNTTTNKYEWNSGAPGAPIWISLGGSGFTQGLDAAKGAASAANAGNFYFSTDVNGGTLYASTGSAWVKVALGLTEPPPVGAGSVTSASIVDGTIVDADISATAGIGPTKIAGTAVITSDSRLTNARTPTAHASTHQPGGSDPMAVDAAAGTGSLRTLGTGAAQAAAGNDSRLSDQRTPTDGSVTAAKIAPQVVVAQGTNYAAVVADKYKLIQCSNPITVTLPSDATSAFAIGESIDFIQYNGQITFAAGAGATVVSYGNLFKSAGQYAMVSAFKIAANVWVLSGALSA